MNNNMSESSQGSAKLEDVEPSDFARFVEYAYRFDYTVPKWEVDKDAMRQAINSEPAPEPAPEPEAEPEQESEQGPGPEPEPAEIIPVHEDPNERAGTSTSKKSKKKKGKLQPLLRSRFETQTYLRTTDPRSTLHDSYEPQSS